MNIEIDKFASAESRARRQYPDHRLDVVFPVCLPVYELRLRVTELRKHELSTTARFILQLSNLGVRQADEFSSVLGLPDNYVASGCAELLDDSLVFQVIDSGIEITDRGRAVLKDGGRSFKPINRHLNVPFDPLTKKIPEIDVERLLDREVLRKGGQYVVPASPRRPRPRNLILAEVKEYYRSQIRRQMGAEILEVIDIKGIKLRYRDDIVVAKLDGPGSSESTFAAYRAEQYLEDESAAIQRLADRGRDLVPDEFKVDRSLPRTIPITISADEEALIGTIKGLDDEIVDTDQETERIRSVRGTTQSSEERRRLEARIDDLETEKEALTTKLGGYEKQLESLSNGETRLIRTEHHRALLLRAIEDAMAHLVLVSAWITPRAFDDEICRALAAAIGRGVLVQIAWGLGARRRRGGDGHRNRATGNRALARLRDLVPKERQRHLVSRLVETHEKFIICDDAFCAWGSFNWLSYRGDIDAGYRRETSYYSERSADITLWRDNSTALFE